MALETNLVANYLLDGNSNDNKGTNNGTDTSVSYVSGKIGQAASYNGTTSVSTFSNLWLTGATDITINAWVKTSTTGVRNTFISGGQSTNTEGFFFFINSSNQLEFDISGYVGTNSTTTITDGVLHMCSIVMTTDSAQLYIDGSSNGTPHVFNPVHNFVTGTSYFGKDFVTLGFFTGVLDNASFWTRALSSSEISQLYNNGLGLYYNRNLFVPPTSGGAFLLNFL